MGRLDLQLKNGKVEAFRARVSVGSITQEAPDALPFNSAQRRHCRVQEFMIGGWLLHAVALTSLSGTSDIVAYGDVQMSD